VPSFGPVSRSAHSSQVRGRALRERAAKAVRSSITPTWAPSVAEEAVDQRLARGVIDLALRLGEALLSTGGSASDVVATVLRVVHAYGLGSCHVDVLFTSISVSYHRGFDHDPMTVQRSVPVRSADYTRLENLQALVRAVVHDGLPVADARRRLTVIMRAPHPYRRWIVTASYSALGAAVAALFGGSLVMMALSAGTTAVVDRVQRRLARRGTAAFFTQAVGAAIPTTVAVLLSAAVSAGVPGAAGISPSLVVVSGIVALLAGLSVVGAAQDAIDGYYVTSSARAFEVVVLTLGLVVGIAAVLATAQRLGVPMEISADLQLDTNPVVQVLAAAAVALAFAVSFYTGARGVVVATVTAGIGWSVYLFGAALGFGPPAASGMAALTIGGLSQLLARRLRVPALAVTTAGIVPLLPGLSVYRGLFQIVESHVEGSLGTGMTSLLGAAGVGFGLAAGVSVGTFLARPRHTQFDRLQRRALRRSAGGARE